MDTLYIQAYKRIHRMNFTKEENDFIFADWPNGDEHYKWLINATREEIENWIDREAITEILHPSSAGQEFYRYLLQAF
jgi:hypothetical protein